MRCGFIFDRPISPAIRWSVGLLAGLLAVVPLALAESADVTLPTVVLTALYPGADALTVRDEVAKPIEDQVNRIEGLRDKKSQPGDGSYTLTLTFESGTDLTVAKEKVQICIGQVWPQLPKVVKESYTVKAIQPMVVPDRQGGSGKGEEFPLKTLVTALSYKYSFLLWGTIFLLSLRSARFPGRGYFSLGFLLLALPSLLALLVPSHDSLEMVRFLDAGITLAAIVCFLLGAAGMRLGSGAGTGTVAGAEVSSNSYYSTDELIARAAATQTANEDVDEIKGQWYKALQRFETELPNRTVLRGQEKFSRTLWLERYTDLGTFEKSGCGQLRTVRVDFAGPGNTLPWMTVQVHYAVDQVPVGQFTIPNVKVVRTRSAPAQLEEFDRIQKFLETGKARVRLEESLTALAQAAGSAALVPVAIPILAAGVAFSPLRRLVGIGRYGTRFVPTRLPDTLPLEHFGLPVGYWNILLTNQADRDEEVLKEVRNSLAARSEFGFKAYQKEVVQWGGYSIKEVRRQTVLEFRRAKVKISVQRYGPDLYVRWDSHINRQCWLLYKYPFRMGVGYRFRKSLFSWAVPLFTEAPAIFEFAPAATPTTDFDWADVDVLQDLAHEVLTGTVRRLKERYRLQQEIDFEMKDGERSDRKSPGESQAEPTRSKRWRTRAHGSE